ncbi:universal stress protein [Alkalihalophilus lindianensis]|uniref:Universal stress protein n=1 Tax=Alkalihalophilus lindianensis TaxID=1630542 RepID=A0ABU3XGS3_9BACI|nr:universal stress protein [Alkalihalophilus lindianensis]MDV2686523.1 universal stress protein [Alkalihalophilus lindianensis]
MFKQIVVAADGSEHSMKAVEKTIELAKDRDTKVFVVYVVDGSTSKVDVLDSWDSLGISEKRNKRLAAMEQQAKSENINYEVKIIRGEPAYAIVQFAHSIEADLIVIGSRGLNQLQQLVLGSVSHKVMKRATCPVLIMR